jgi:hypothetical protein
MYENLWGVKPKTEALNSFSVVLQELQKFGLIQNKAGRLARCPFGPFAGQSVGWLIISTLAIVLTGKRANHQY